MPGQSPYEATEAFLSPIRNALSCVARAKIVTSTGGRHSVAEDHAWTINGDEGADLGQGRVFTATMGYRIIRDDREDYGPFRVTTKGYIYTLTQGAHEHWSFHWHPAGNSWEKKPHLHLGDKILRNDAPITSKSHLATSRVSFEQAIRWTIEFGTAPLVDDWSNRLTLAETPFLLFRSWHERPDEGEARASSE